MAAHTWEALANKYRDWRAPTVSLSLGGKPLLQQGWRLLSLQCQLSVEMEASTCTVTLGNVYNAAKREFTCESALIPGTLVELSLGYIVMEPVFKGYLYEVEYVMGEDSEEVILNCMDVKGAMMENSRIAPNGTYKEIIQGMFTGASARSYSLLCSKPDLGLPELDRPVAFSTARMDDYTFLKRTSEVWGLECFTQVNKLLLRKKPASGSPLLEFLPGTFHTLSATFSTVGYVRTVRVRGGSDDERDGEKKRALGEAVNKRRFAPDGTQAGKVLDRTSESYAAGARNDKTAKALAEAELRRRARKSGGVTVKLRGLPELLPGHYVDFQKISPKINGRYYVTSVQHQYDGNTFTTSAECGRD